jgi:hypothetical protein
VVSLPGGSASIAPGIISEKSAATLALLRK